VITRIVNQLQSGKILELGMGDGIPVSFARKCVDFPTDPCLPKCLVIDLNFCWLC
jgi:hypothetical protein